MIDSIVYRKLAAHMTYMGMRRRDVADKLGISYGTLHNKLAGVTPWTLDECKAMKTILMIDGPIESWFQRSDTVSPDADSVGA